MSTNIKKRIKKENDVLSKEEIEADFNRHSKRVPHSQTAMSRSYDKKMTAISSVVNDSDNTHYFKKRVQKMRTESDSTIRELAKKDPFLASRIRQEDTLRNLYEERIRRESVKDKASIFLSIALIAPFFLHIGKGYLSTVTDFLFAFGFAGIILYGPLRKQDSAIKGVSLTFLTFFVFFISPYWQTAYELALKKGTKADSFFHLLTVTPLKYILITVIVAATFISYEKIGTSISSLYHAKR